MGVELYNLDLDAQRMLRVGDRSHGIGVARRLTVVMGSASLAASGR